jgi:diguanylate cyclase (GGDEF)-like protein
LTRELPFYRRITFRLVALFGVLTLIGSLLGGYLSIHLAKQEFFRVMERQFNSSSRLAENSLDIIGQMARTWSFNFATHNNLDNSVRGASQTQLSQEVEHMRESAHCDTLIILDHVGHILQHSAFNNKTGESLMAWQIVRQAVNERKSSYAIIEESGNFIIYGSGITPTDKQHPHPYIVLTGFRISDELVSKLSQDTSIGLTFIRRTSVMTSTFNTAQRKLINSPVAYLDYQILYNDSRLSREVKIDDQIYYASVRHLNLLDPSMDGSLLLTYPRNELNAIIERLQEEYLWLYAAGMLLFALFIWRISLRTMQPLRKLAARVENIAKGDLTPTVIVQNDEIGNIASSINDLLGELASSRQTINQHAEELKKTVEQRTRELRVANEELSHQSTHDAMTGLPNRKLFNDRLSQSLLMAHRSTAGMALMFIDLDRFKWVNDTFGHATGDALLKIVAERIQSCLREGDTVSRLGGDEFTVILSQSGTLLNIEEVAVRILSELTTPFDLPGANQTQISASIGIAQFPEHGDTAAKLLLHADHAMYNAKKAGRATYCFWHSEMTETEHGTTKSEPSN